MWTSVSPWNVAVMRERDEYRLVHGRGLHSSNFQLNLSHF